MQGGGTMVSRPVPRLGSTASKTRRGHQYPPCPTTPVVLRYSFLNTGWLAELLDVGKESWLSVVVIFN